MNISEDNLTARRCFKCNQTLLDNLNIACNPNNSIVVLWNKYQIFVYDNFTFNEITKSIVPDFQISCLIISNNYLACLDTTGKIHLIALKFKNAAPKLLNNAPKLQQDGNYLGLYCYEKDCVLCLKSYDGTLKLCFYRFDAEFKLIEQISILHDASLLQKKRKYTIFKSYSLSQNKRKTIESIKNIFNMPEDILQGSYIFTIVSFDGKTVMFTLYNETSKPKETTLRNLYSCASDLACIELLNEDDLYLLMALKTGTIIKLSLTDKTSKTHIVHLNTAIDNLIVLNNTLLYTDGLTMWKSENTYSNDIKLTKSTITQVKDLIRLNSIIICTTFTKFIYVFQIDDEKCYINTDTDEYCSASVVLNNSYYLKNIIEEIDKNDELVKKINAEENYILCLSLSNRQDVMDNMIKINIIVYDKYEDAITDNSSIILTERFNTYFEYETVYMLVTICINSMQHVFNQILFSDVVVHLTFISDNKVLKTSSIKLKEQLKKINFLIPLVTEAYRLKVFIILAVKLPGVHDKKQTVWNILYKKEILLNSEHFIKTEEKTKSITFMKSEETLSNLILSSAKNQYGNIFEFTNIINNKVPHNKNFAFYVKLPFNYKEIFTKDDFCKEKFSHTKTKFFLQQYSSEEFLNSKNNVILTIRNTKVTVEIINDTFSSSVLKVFSENIIIAYDIRNFFANILYDGFKSNTTAGEEHVKHTFYTVVENNQKALKNCVSSSNIDGIKQQIDIFERNVIGNLPI